MNWFFMTLIWTAALSAAFGGAARAQTTPWDIFDDTQSTSTCDVVNTADTELVVLRNSGELVIVTGLDNVLPGSVVNAVGDVFIDDQPSGIISFQEDADGFRTLFWTSFAGRVIDVDGLTFEVRETDLFPSEISNVPCGVCDSGLWDIRADCDDVIIPPVTIRLCGNDVVIAMIMSFGGLFVFAFPARRRRK